MAERSEITQANQEQYPKERTLLEISRDYQNQYATPLIAAKVDHVMKDLQDCVGAYKKIEFVETASLEGVKVYQRSVVFLLITAARDLFPGAEVTIEHSLSHGLYCEIYPGRILKKSDVAVLAARMREIVAENRPIVKKTVAQETAVNMFKERGDFVKAQLIASLQRAKVSLFYCGDFYDYLYGPMADFTSCLDLFALDYHAPGMVLRTPLYDARTVPPFVPQPKLARIFAEAENWAHIMECQYVVDLNALNRGGQIGDVIRISEALHEKKIAQIADFIAAHIDRLHLILIAGPSSSGKTTFAQRLRIQLRVNGIKPLTISLDDYFLDRAYTPRDADGNYNFEALEALDVALFNQNMLDLFQGKSVEIPYYNFVTGKREMRGHMVSLQRQQPIIVEGIHGLNEKLTAKIPRGAKYKIYVSPLTQLAIDGHNRIPTTDARLVRRIVRDHRARGSNALKTIRQWPLVRRGEEQNIFPYQEEADVMFNTALIYELGMLKKYAEPLLRDVDKDCPEYGETVRLLDFFQYFDHIQAESDIPVTSILREFIGQSCFGE